MRCSSSLEQHVKLQCFDEDCLRNVTTISAAAPSRNMPAEEKFNFYHNPSKLSTLILESYAISCVVYVYFYACVCFAVHLGAAEW